MFAPLFQAAGFLDIMDTVNDLNFVIRILVFSYFLFWLFVTFHDIPIMFGMSVIGISYLLFVAAIPMIIVAIVFLIFITPFGQMLQQLIWFGFQPLFGERGVSEQEAQKVQEKVMRGEQLNKREEAILQQLIEQQQMQQQLAGAMMMRRR